MEVKSFIGAGLELPAIGVGTWKYTGGVEPLRRAIEIGACLIDTAEGYGTEEIVGEAINGLRNKVMLSTKVWPTHFRYKDVIKAADNSLKRLRTTYIDLYQLHWPNPDIPISETMQAMEDLVDAGKIRFIGVSNFWTRELKRARASMSRHRIAFNQMSYSLIDRRIETSLLPYCVANQIAVIAYTPLGGGLSHIQMLDRTNALQRVSQITGKTAAQVALNWCILNENVVAVAKANSINHVEENCGSVGWRLSPDHVETLQCGIKARLYGRTQLALRRTARRLSEDLGLRQPIHKISID